MFRAGTLCVLLLAGCGGVPSINIGGVRVTSTQLCAGDVNCRLRAELRSFDAERALSLREPGNWLGHAIWEVDDEYGFPALCGEDLDAEELKKTVLGAPYVAAVAVTSETARQIAVNLETQFGAGELNSEAKLILHDSVQSALGAKVDVQVQPYSLDSDQLVTRRALCRAKHTSGGNMIVGVATVQVGGTTDDRLTTALEVAASTSSQLNSAFLTKVDASGSIKEATTLVIQHALAPYERVMMVGITDF